MGTSASMKAFRALALVAGGSAAFAGSIPAVMVTASNQQGSSSWSIPLPANVPNYDYRNLADIELRDPTNNNLIGTIRTIEVALDGLPSSDTGIANPQVTLNFAVQAGTSNTDFEISSALVSFTTLNSPSGRANAGFSISDLTGDGARLEGRAPAGAGYIAQYNGFVPSGSTFAGGLGLLDTPASFGTDTEALNVPDPVNFAPIGTPVSNISAQVSFNLTAEDLASGTSNYQLIPEPTSLLMLSIAAFGLRRR